MTNGGGKTHVKSDKPRETAEQKTKEQAKK